MNSGNYGAQKHLVVTSPSSFSFTYENTKAQRSHLTKISWKAYEYPGAQTRSSKSEPDNLSTTFQMELESMCSHPQAHIFNKASSIARKEACTFASTSLITNVGT